ncbi:MAG: flagellar export chaperone FliS [Sutterellaceae bacterium]|nr:flagellar export chaperone FliS [Burkholderiaceae bacterium]MCX7902002.1 flagellar export chaperone FliS [Burkholderiaceae bacterium]MDW8430897.1 flagellar export chaperone FliS [Sutterellaceae bacterium]
MNGFAAQTYRRVDLDSRVAAADPHQLVLLLFDGALEALHLAASHLAAGRIAQKGQALAKAVRIVEEGLKASLDYNAGGALAQQLASLYDYCVFRLLQANLRNDAKAVAEVTALLSDLREAWAAIGARQRSAAPQERAASALALTA